MMDTLHEVKTSLLSAPDHETTNSLSHSDALSGAERAENRDESVAAVYRTIAVRKHSEHLAADYDTPVFPCREVSYARSKRAFDILFSAVFLLVSWPCFLLIALLVKLTSRGPVIFRQERVGQGGRPFTCYKFRSMCADAETRKEKLMSLNEASGPVFKIKNDPRITPLGAFLRKFSLDELPQFINVLKGEMSLVGPRPPLPCEVSAYSAYQRQRLAVKPGLTCLWQVSGRSNISFERWVELDLMYIENMSFFNDLKIILKTIPAVFLGEGAH